MNPIRYKSQPVLPWYWWVALAWMSGVLAYCLIQLFSLIGGGDPPLLAADEGLSARGDRADRTDRYQRSQLRIDVPNPPVQGRQPVERTGNPAPSAPLPPILDCIRFAESRDNYRSVNPAGYYGAFQLSSYYSDTWAGRYGVGQFASLTADRWPRWAQNKVALGLFNDWPGAWTTYGSCA